MGPLLDPLGAIVKHNFVILDAMHEENECETCLRGVEFRFLCASLSHIAATGVEIGERRNMPLSAGGGRNPVSCCLRFGPPAVRNRAHPFPDADEPISRDLLKSLVHSTWPIDINIDRRGASQPEVQAEIAA